MKLIKKRTESNVVTILRQNYLDPVATYLYNLGYSTAKSPEDKIPLCPLYKSLIYSHRLLLVSSESTPGSHARQMLSSLGDHCSGTSQTTQAHVQGSPAVHATPPMRSVVQALGGISTTEESLSARPGIKIVIPPSHLGLRNSPCFRHLRWL